jgi:hypothetical protein
VTVVYINRADTAAELAPPAPPCFSSAAQWIEWVRAAADAQKGGAEEGPLWFSPDGPRFNRALDYCADCSAAYRSEMLREGRCKPKHLLES